jgi:hypothetical protein
MDGCLGGICARGSGIIEPATVRGCRTISRHCPGERQMNRSHNVRRHKDDREVRETADDTSFVDYISDDAPQNVIYFASFKLSEVVKIR